MCNLELQKKQRECKLAFSHRPRPPLFARGDARSQGRTRLLQETLPPGGRKGRGSAPRSKRCWPSGYRERSSRAERATESLRERGIGFIRVLTRGEGTLRGREQAAENFARGRAGCPSGRRAHARARALSSSLAPSRALPPVLALRLVALSPCSLACLLGVETRGVHGQDCSPEDGRSIRVPESRSSVVPLLGLPTEGCAGLSTPSTMTRRMNLPIGGGGTESLLKGR